MPAAQPPPHRLFRAEAIGGCLHPIAAALQANAGDVDRATIAAGASSQDPTSSKVAEALEVELTSEASSISSSSVAKSNGEANEADNLLTSALAFLSSASVAVASRANNCRARCFFSSRERGQSIEMGTDVPRDVAPPPPPVLAFLLPPSSALAAQAGLLQLLRKVEPRLAMPPERGTCCTPRQSGWVAGASCGAGCGESLGHLACRNCCTHLGVREPARQPLLANR